jgi:hypothetical protein
VLTGTGPLTWSHNNEMDGIWDINGNVSEWTGGIRTVKGELQILANNDAADSNNPQTAASVAWKAINASDGTLITPNGIGTTSGSIKVDKVSNKPQFATSVVTESDSFSASIDQITCSEAISDEAKAVLLALGLIPDGTATSYNSDTLYFNNVADERLFFSGGGYGSGAGAGVGYCYGFASSRSYTGANLGFRLAYFDPQ